MVVSSGVEKVIGTIEKEGGSGPLEPTGDSVEETRETWGEETQRWHGRRDILRVNQ